MIIRVLVTVVPPIPQADPSGMPASWGSTTQMSYVWAQGCVITLLVEWNLFGSDGTVMTLIRRAHLLAGAFASLTASHSPLWLGKIPLDFWIPLKSYAHATSSQGSVKACVIQMELGYHDSQRMQGTGSITMLIGEILHLFNPQVISNPTILPLSIVLLTATW